jgi:serine/threonine protein kinase
LATNDLAHRDLKLENILFDENWKLKIADFGLSRDARGDRNDYVLRSRVGTNGYQPPEMNTGRRTYTGINSDLFASGVILFLMYNGSLPFSSTRADDRVYNLIRNRNYERFWSLHEAQHEPNFYPIAFKRLMNSFFCADPEHRLRL